MRSNKRTTATVAFFTLLQVLAKVHDLALGLRPPGYPGVCDEACERVQVLEHSFCWAGWSILFPGQETDSRTSLRLFLAVRNSIQKSFFIVAFSFTAPHIPTGGSVTCNLASEEYRMLIHTTKVAGLVLVWHVDLDRDPKDCR
jgi:hypothetical protein